jgi:hypothetical protein
MPYSPYQEIIQQIDSDHAILFLGAGSTRNCRHSSGRRGLTGDELAQAILKELNGGVDPQLKGIGLAQASEFYVSSNPAARNGLDHLVKRLLSDLRPTVGHYLAASFPWRAIVTTNYNRVPEDAWADAHDDRYAANELLAIRTDIDLGEIASDDRRTRLYKPHGCISLPQQQQHRMVLTSLDYFESERIRKNIYKEVRSLSKDCSTVFIGYSLNDHTFRNIFYTLYEKLRQWKSESYCIGPISDPLYEKWFTRSMKENFKINVINESFDTFMLRLTINRGYINPTLKAKVLSLWGEVEDDNKQQMNGLEKDDIANLPER